MSEALVRRIDIFGSFLELVALRCAEEINFEAFGSDLGVSGKSIKNFFGILEDTLTGFLVPPFRKTKLRKATSRSKFYLSDIGVANCLVGRKEMPTGTEAFGRAFEHLIAMELRAYLSYRRLDHTLCFWRTESGYEVDFTVGSELAVEVKASDLVTERHLSALRALREEGIFRTLCVVSRDTREREIDGMRIYPWRVFLTKLWGGALL
jgi:predicted AAA+ superfamily ATPase